MRIEKDSMGEVQIGAGMLYGAQTERARQLGLLDFRAMTEPGTP